MESSSYSDQIVANRLITPDGTMLHSYHRHDYKTYTDKNGLVYMVDGGNDYLRRTRYLGADGTEASVYMSDDFAVIREAFHWGTRGKGGRDPLEWRALMNLDTDHIEAILETQNHIASWVRSLMEKELQYRKDSVNG